MNFSNLFFLILFFVNVSFAQNSKKTSTIIYKISTNNNVEDLDLETSIKNRIKAINKASDLIECKLHFNVNESVFYQEKKMSLNNDQSYKLASIVIRGLYYSNIKDSLKILNKNFSDVNFNVIIPFNKHRWQITNETKEIGGYKCFKANKIVSKSNIIAWFTNQIPVPFGPNGIDGLPGLILETTINEKLTFYATQINFNETEVKFLEKPKANKTITEEDFLKMASNKMADFFNEN
ncbi:GLPGLI family protein [Lacinutrix sp. WUR7]|uniref:GLPGLI family protein n=1 Tax=Lacinutrix sp. WUR7 TaxID=2653681 RepID=UPI00193D4489|nr:GLPGLI family protein [Lacinutrix sp. WUR7]QRM88780.1 GLPGLI family protein [Lacinutrix sp. WUR7]